MVHWKKIISEAAGGQRPLYIPVTRQPLAEIIGYQRVLIENYKGLLAYTDESVSIDVSFGTIEILGEHLHISLMSSEKIVICGQISGVHLLKGGVDG